MESEFGHDRVARCDAKRKRSDVRNRGDRNSGSGNGQEYPGDPPTAQVPAGLRGGVTEGSAFLGLRAETSFYGVRTRVVVEIKGWARKGRGDKSGDFYMDVKSVKDWGMQTVAATIHDLARLYQNRQHPVKSLNIHRVEVFIRKQDLEEELCIGKGLLDKYVRDNPLTLGDVLAGSKEFTALKENIAERALLFLNILKDKITEELSRAGRQRQDEDQIFPAVEGVDPSEEAEIENQRLQNRVASLEKTVAAQDGTITSLMVEALDPGTANTDVNSPIPGSEEFLQHIQHLHLQIADLKVTHAAELKAKDDRIASLKEELQAAQCLITTSRPSSPLLGYLLAPRVSSGCKFTPLLGLVSSIDWSLSSYLSMKQQCRLSQDSKTILVRS